MELKSQLTCQLPNTPEEDLNLIANHLAGDNELRFNGLIELLKDPDEAIRLFDETNIQECIVSLKGKIGDSLFCYVEVRKRLLHVGIHNRELAIYLSNIWCGYRENGILPNLDESGSVFVETVDILRELNFVQGYEKFELLAMSGNYFLFLMAFFEGYFHEMEAKAGAPSMAYYEAFARIAFRAARDHGLSGEFELTSVYNELSENLTEVRAALSGLY